MSCVILRDDLYRIVIFLQRKMFDIFHVEMVPMKATLLCVLLCLLWSLVEVQSQNKYPYISFKGTTLPNHSYVDLTQVREDITSSDSNTVQCHTNLNTCCRANTSIGVVGRGDWFAPGSDTRMPFGSEYRPYYMYEDRQTQVVHIRRRNDARNEPSGIYRCVIPTNAVHDDSDGSVGETVYVGLYKNGGIIANTLSIPHFCQFLITLHLCGWGRVIGCVYCVCVIVCYFLLMCYTVYESCSSCILQYSSVYTYCLTPTLSHSLLLSLAFVSQHQKYK